MSKFVDRVDFYYFEPDPKDFSEQQRKRVDFEGLRRYFVKIYIKDITPDYYEAFKFLNKIQYKLPMKYLKPVNELCSYVSQKSLLYENEKDIKNASITIEPLHSNFFNMIIPHTPINQSLPLETVFTINVSIPYLNDRNDMCPECKFIWSNNLKVRQEIVKEIEKIKPDSNFKRPFLECVHFGAIDIGCELKGKFIVSNIDLDLMQSYNLFGFRRSDERKELVLWIYNYYNVSISDLLEMISTHCDNKLTKLLMKEVKENLPRECKRITTF
jgi:hypothetical protein